MNNMVHPQQVHLPIDEITSPLGAQFEFSESELFPETVQNNSEVGSINSSNNCYFDQEDSSYNPTNLSITIDDMNNSNYNSATTPPPANATISSTPTTRIRHHPPIFFEDDRLDNDILESFHFMPSPPSFSHPHNQEYLNNNNNNNYNYGQEVLFSTFNDDIGISLGESMGPQPNGQPEGGYFSCVSHHLPQSYNVRLMSDAAPALADHMNMNSEPYFPMSRLNGSFSFGGQGIMSFTAGGNMFLGGDHHFSHQELELEGDNIIGSMARVFNCSTGDLQVVSSESQHVVHHQGSPTTTLASDISCSLEDPNFNVPKLSPEERKRKILRYLKKRNERNFSKKIKYACRKTLADSRPRVRGRFAKNDELAEMGRTKLGDRDTDEDAAALFSINPHIHKVVEGGEGLETDIFAEMNGVNSFRCDYPIQSWI